ncbi:hypothetical protein CO165_01600 [Candidatus Roizmanbacteria bacterium CG_4_9_14_3_um_filter_33_18]|uniref:CYTH domain-containing protein n=2 Tax=Candidatus Roizmaniibacteriota TaxID=1752723 RepID=A0A2M7XYU9_9BACT|nr:MAG: hypothetical protein COW97_01125 [Candidatus Roizmanbacteria bacterium CG22_combo_CG10-13_8_21_14_all_34_12]PJA55810.1 MAG: hypothetical protein CO165_01600 [Candidatus Roizmanbacteria bacterium CG_4_9_14_3_um_filter_33_18]
MKYQEKKYKVDSFVTISKLLNEKGAKNEKEVVTMHYYTQQPNNEVVKLVEYDNHNEIHILTESNGKYLLKQKIPVLTTEAGLKWLKDKGYKIVDLVKMVYTDYEYKNGIVGLYVINDFLYSVILDFPEGQLKTIENEFGLSNIEIINIPYNKLLDQLGRLHSVDL